MKHLPKIKKHRSHISGRRFMASRMGKKRVEALAKRDEKVRGDKGI